jgi:hypothetical protein
LPARHAIFVTQFGRKFRLFSLTLQRYEKIKSLPNYSSKKARKKARGGHLVICQLSLTFLDIVKNE